MMNRIANCNNPYQGNFKKVLCVCSAGLLRSPTAAVVLSQAPYDYNTRAVGVHTEYALTPIEEVHLHWADEVVCMEKWQADAVEQMIDAIESARGFPSGPPRVMVLGIEDSHPYRSPELMKQIREAYDVAVAQEV